MSEKKDIRAIVAPFYDTKARDYDLLKADTLADPNVPNYIKAGFKTELAFLKWLCPKTKTENNIEEYRKWGYPSRGAVLEAYGKTLRKAKGLPPSIEEDDDENEQTCFVIPSGKHIED